MVFSKAANRHVLETELWLPRPAEEVFAFFSEASNLGELTPKWLQWEILTPSPIEMQVGTLIDYRIKLRGMPMRWRTVISAWDPPHRFIDEQLRGPYTHWLHEHTFEHADGGTLCRDRVEYAHVGGDLIHRLIVRPDLERIFGHRQCRMRALFGEPATAGSSASSPPHAEQAAAPEARLRA